MTALLTIDGLGGPTWVLDGASPEGERIDTADHDSPRTPALAVLRFTGDPRDDMDLMESLLAEPTDTTAPRIVAAVGFETAAVVGVLLDPGDATDPTTPAQCLFERHHFTLERWILSTAGDLAEVVGPTPQPLTAAQQLAAVVYHHLGMPLSRLRTHRLDECPIPELRHACGHEYFWCAHEAAYVNSLVLLSEEASTDSA